MDKADITPELAARLLAAQFPQWASLPIRRVEIDGWDNTTFRLGDELSLRLPSAQAYAAQVEKEQRWLPRLASQLPLPIPAPVGLGRPCEGFPHPWSIYRWIEGETLRAQGLTHDCDFAIDLASFLAALQLADTKAAPVAGLHNFFRGASLRVWDSSTRDALETLGPEIDTRAAIDCWQAGLGSRWERAPVWVHGDVSPSNLLMRNGRLSAVIDFGCSAIGDPACDLVIAWTFLDEEGRSTFRDTLHLDTATWARARGWALWKALIALAEDRRGGVDADAAAHRFGWRVSPHEVIELVLAEHRRTRHEQRSFRR